MDTLRYFEEEQRKLKLAIDQIHQLKIKIQNVNLRFNHAKRQGTGRAKGGYLAMQLLVLISMQKIYACYAREKHAANTELRYQLYGHLGFEENDARDENDEDPYDEAGGAEEEN